MKRYVALVVVLLAAGVTWPLLVITVSAYIRPTASAIIAPGVQVERVASRSYVVSVPCVVKKATGQSVSETCWDIVLISAGETQNMTLWRFSGVNAEAYALLKRNEMEQHFRVQLFGLPGFDQQQDN